MRFLAPQTNYSALLLDPSVNVTVLVPNEAGFRLNGGEWMQAGQQRGPAGRQMQAAAAPLLPASACPKGCTPRPRHCAGRAMNSTSTWMDPALAPAGALPPPSGAPDSAPPGGPDDGGAPAVGGLPPGIAMDAWNGLGGYHFLPQANLRLLAWPWSSSSGGSGRWPLVSPLSQPRVPASPL